MGKVIKDILIVLIITVLLIVLIEGVFRLFVREATNPLFFEQKVLMQTLGISSLGEIMEADDYLFWKVKPGLKKHEVRGKILDDSLRFHVTTDKDGLRKHVSSGSEIISILALGNSCTFGLGVSDEETWPAMLQKKLQTHHNFPVQVMNAGVPGYSSFQGYRMLQRIYDSIHPQWVIVNFGFNDIATWSSLSDEEMAQRIASPLDKLLSKSAIYGAMKYRGQKKLAEKQVEAYLNDDRKGHKPRMESADFVKTMKEIAAFCHERNSKVLFLIWPYRHQVAGRQTSYIAYQQETHVAALQSDSYLLNFVDPFMKEEDCSAFFIDNIHLNAEGLVFVASLIANTIVTAE